jgi:hypothetical protein
VAACFFGIGRVSLSHRLHVLHLLREGSSKEAVGRFSWLLRVHWELVVHLLSGLSIIPCCCVWLIGGCVLFHFQVVGTAKPSCWSISFDALGSSCFEPCISSLCCVGMRRVIVDGRSPFAGCSWHYRGAHF